MSSPPGSDPHIVSLVLQSKKALQNGEQLCLKANELSTASIQASVDVLVLDAKVRWITDNVLEQLKVFHSRLSLVNRLFSFEVSWQQASPGASKKSVPNWINKYRYLSTGIQYIGYYYTDIRNLCLGLG